MYQQHHPSVTKGLGPSSKDGISSSIYVRILYNFADLDIFFLNKDNSIASVTPSI